MDFLNSKQRKVFFQSLREDYGYAGPTDYVVYLGGKGKHYIISRDLEKIPFEDVGIRQGGLYVASEQGGGMRLTMDGAQLFGPHCEKEAVQLTLEERDAWMDGMDIPYGGDEDGFVIVRWGEDILGCGRVVEGEIKNYVPKERRISDPHA